MTNKSVQVRDCGLRVDGSKHHILSESSGNVDVEVSSRMVLEFQTVLVKLLAED